MSDIDNKNTEHEVNEATKTEVTEHTDHTAHATHTEHATEKKATHEKHKAKKKSGGGLSDVIASEHKKANKVKISRKDLKKDELAEASSKVVEYLTKQGNNVLIATGTALAIIIIIIIVSLYSTSKEEKANELFTSARNLYDLALNESPPSSTTLKASLEIFENLISSYNGNIEEALAYLYEGNIYFNLQDYEKAIDAYNKFLSSNKNATYSIVAKTNIAYCYKNMGSAEKAIDLFKNISETSSGYVKESSLLDLGLTYEKINNNGEAVKIYQDFIKNYPTSSLVEKVHERINSIQAK